MTRFSEETFKAWHQPASKTEEKRISNALSMIKDGISKHPNLLNLDIDVFIQGSYGNNTNVRKESDIDVCIMLRRTFFYKLPTGMSMKDFGIFEGTITFSDYQKWVNKAMHDKFGSEYVDIGNKSIKIKSNSYHVHADVVPAFQFRNYSVDQTQDTTRFIEGIKFFSSDEEEVINYPKIHIENGKQKNVDTHRRYKRMIRIFKRIKIQMDNEGKSVNGAITSFLISGLIWNLPNSVFNDHKTWKERIRAAIIYLWNRTKGSSACEDLTEISEMLPLFSSNRKWTPNDVHLFLGNMWRFLEFKS